MARRLWSFRIFMGVLGFVLALPWSASAWSDPVLVNTGGVADSQRDMTPDLAVDASDTLHAVWASTNPLAGTGDDFDIHYSSNAGTGWSAPVAVNSAAASDTGDDMDPRIIVAASGELHVIWQSEEDCCGTGTDPDIFHSVRSGSSWSPPVLVNSPGMSDFGREGQAKIMEDSTGVLHAVWSSPNSTGGFGGDRDLFHAWNSGSGWSDREPVNSNALSDSEHDDRPEIIEDATGALHVVWEGEESIGGSGDDFDVFHVVDSGSGWSAPALLNVNGTSDTGRDALPHILSDSSGLLHAAWTSTEDLAGSGTDGDLFYSTNSGTGWSSPILMNSYGATELADDGAVRMMEASDGVIHAVWYARYDIGGTGQDIDIMHATLNGATWSDPAMVNNSGVTDDETDNWPHIVEDSAGFLHVIWESEADVGGSGLDEDILHAYLDPSSVPTPTPAPTASPTPAALWYDLDMPDLLLTPGENFLLLTHLGNPTAISYPVDEYIVLDVAEEYWFYPSWTQAVDLWTGTIPPGGPWDTTILEFPWPTGAGAGSGIKFWAALLDQGTTDLILLDMVEWGWGT